MSYMLMHLRTAWAVDQAILSEERRIVIIRFGHDYDSECMKMDECLYRIADKIREMAVIYVVDITEVPDFNKMYELYDPCTVMFFYRNRHVMIDLGTGNNNKSLSTRTNRTKAPRRQKQTLALPNSQLGADEQAGDD